MWKVFPSLQLPRDGLASAVVGDKMLVFGGRSVYRIENSVEIFDGERWRVGPAMPFGLERHCAVAIDQQHILVAGGNCNTTELSAWVTFSIHRYTGCCE